MSEREKILTRIREALTLTAPSHGAESSDSATGFSKWLPLVGPTEEARFELFRANSLELKTDFRLLDSVDDFAHHLAEIATVEQWEKVATHDHELTGVCDRLGLPVLRTDGGYDVRELEGCSVGISGCDALIAQTGSVLVTNRSAGGRALSVLPPHHVVLARRAQLLPDLPSATALLRSRHGESYPSFISFITGPSRTGDIERILVLGAHGPKKLTVLCA